MPNSTSRSSSNSHLSEKLDIETTDEEIYYWSLYDFANAGFMVSILFSLPLMLDSMLRIQACSNLPEDQICDEDGEPPEGVTLKVPLLGIRIESFAYFVIAISVIFQTIAFISFGALADHGGHQIFLWKLFTIIGCVIAISTVALAPFENAWWGAALILIIGNLIYGCSVVFYNSHLATLAQNLGGHLHIKQIEAKTIEMSHYGASMNYFGQFANTIITSALLIFLGGDRYDSSSTLYAFGLATTLGGFWWLVIGLYCIGNVPNRDITDPNEPGWWAQICLSWSETYQMLYALYLAERPETWIVKWFMISYFFFSDAYGTIGSAGVLIAQQELKSSTTTLGLCFLIIIFVAGIGIKIFEMIQIYLHWSPRKMLQLILVIYFFLCCFGIFVYENWQLYIFVTIHGFCIGAVQSYARALFTSCIPKGEQGKYFGIYEITDRGSSWLGPMITGILGTFTSIRWTFAYIMTILVISCVILSFLPDEFHILRSFRSLSIDSCFEKSDSEDSKDNNP